MSESVSSKTLGSAFIDPEPPAYAGAEDPWARDAASEFRSAQHGLTPVARILKAFGDFFEQEIGFRFDRFRAACVRWR